MFYLLEFKLVFTSRQCDAVSVALVLFATIQTAALVHDLTFHRVVSLAQVRFLLLELGPLIERQASGSIVV